MRPSHTPALLKIYEAGFLRGEEGLSISNVSPAGRKMYLSQGAAGGGGFQLSKKNANLTFGLEIFFAAAWTYVGLL